MEEVTAVLFIGCCLFIPMLLSIFINFELPQIPHKKEKIVIQRVYIYKQIKNNKADKKKDIPEPQKEKVSNPLYPECIECLVSLGMKRSEAKLKVKIMFEANDYQSIESFLIDAYKIN